MDEGVKIISPQEGFQEYFVRSNVDVVFGGGVLNPQPLDSLVATPDGFVRMGDLRAGNTIINPLGGTQKVVFTIDKGVQHCVEFTLHDGRKVRSAFSHHWMVLDESGETLDLSASEIMEGMSEGQVYYIPLTQHGTEYLDKCSTMFGDGEVVVESKEIAYYKDMAWRCGFNCYETKIKDGFTKLKIGTEGYAYIAHYEITQPCEMRCINVSGDEHIYLTDNYVITRNCGKAQPLYSKVLTPNGFVRMGDLKVGDTIVASNGGTQKVLQIYERGILDNIRFTFDDGTSVECCPEHLWTVWDSINKTYITTEAKKIAEDMNRYSLPLHKMLRLSEDFYSNLSYADSIRARGYKVTEKYDDVIVSRDRKRFVSVKELGKAQMRCILVSSEDHLYITDGFNLTHNTFAAILSTAEPTLDPNFRACFIRRTLGELKTGGGMVDDFEAAFGDYVQIKKSDNPRITFPTSSFVEMRQINDENKQKITEQWKGAQFDLIYMDELTSYQFSTFSYLLSRNRGKANWTGKFRGTTNPERNCWVRKFIDYYVGEDGQIIPERNGVVRYFYMAGDTINDVVWGDTKEEVYKKCRIDIDVKLRSLGGEFTYKNLIKSFTFYLGRMSENKASIGKNMDYAGSVAAVGGKQAKQLIEGNWNVSSMVSDDAPIYYDKSVEVFNNDPCINNDYWITVDLADTGTDNTIVLVWNGLHVLEYKTLQRSTPAMNVGLIRSMADKHDIPDTHIIYDGVRAVYVADYIPDALPFISYKRPYGKYWRGFERMKDDCYMRLVKLINAEKISVSPEIGESLYEHQNLKTPITFSAEFVEECSVVRFKQLPSGRYKLLTKKEMNAVLGKGRSMDVLDSFAMRMYPFLNFQYGEELEMSAKEIEYEEKVNINSVNVFNESLWA